MPHVKTEGVVLSRRLSGEADYICSVYTRDFGREQFIFRGLKKSRKRSISASEPGSIITIAYTRKENNPVHTVSDCETITGNDAARNNPARFFAMCFLVELVERTCGEGDSSIELYSFITRGLRALGTTEFTGHFVLFFTLRYMDLLGILPSTGACSRCGSADSASYEVESSTLRFVCESCSGYAQPDISGATAGFTRECRVKKFSGFSHEGVPEEEVYLLIGKTADYIEHYYGFRLRTTDMLLRYARDLNKQKGGCPGSEYNGEPGHNPPPEKG